MGIWSGVEGQRALDGLDSAIWTKVAGILDTRGWMFEGDIPFFGKDVIRQNERRIKLRLRKHGYSGPGIHYLEENVGGVNGYAFFCKGKRAEPDVRAELRLRLENET